MTVTILVSIACFIIGGFLSYMFFKHGLKSKYDNVRKPFLRTPEPAKELENPRTV